MMNTPAVDWPTFFTAVALLLAPLPLFFGRNVRYHDLSHSWANHASCVFGLSWHWLDLLRSLAGTWLLMYSLGFTDRDGGPAPDRFAIPLLALMVLLSVIVQVVACKFPDSFHAPFAAVIALIVLLLPPFPSVLTLVSALTVAVAFRSPVAFFAAVPFAAALVCFLLYRNFVILGIVGAASFIPAVLPTMFRRNLVLARRRRNHDSMPSMRDERSGEGRKSAF